MATPKVFGPHVWFCLHNTAVHYPDHPTFEQKNQMKMFVKSFPVMLTCKTCFDYTQNIMNNINIDQVVENRYTLFTFFFKLHNQVNKKINKRILSWEEVSKIWNFYL